MKTNLEHLINIKSEYNGFHINITGGIGFHIDYIKAFINILGSNYGFHPTTGKQMNEEDFNNIAKEQNWTPIQILNNLKNIQYVTTKR